MHSWKKKTKIPALSLDIVAVQDNEVEPKLKLDSIKCGTFDVKFVSVFMIFMCKKCFFTLRKIYIFEVWEKLSVIILRLFCYCNNT
jgi:hypothetical protein